MDKQNIEMINGIPVDWGLFKSNSKGGHTERSKKSYVGLCELLHNKNHKLLSDYISNSIKVLIDYNCSHKPHWITPHNYKNGIGCPRCVGQGGQAKEDFIKLINKNEHILLSEYVNTDTKVLIDFNCGHKPHWVTPNCYKRGQSCPKCGGLRSKQIKEDFISLINKNNHKLLSEYTNTTTKVLIDFNCEHEPHWTTPDNYKGGSRCPKCRRRRSKQAEEIFMNMLEENNHKLLSEYINTKTKVLIDFNCGHEPSLVTPTKYKDDGVGCPRCHGRGGQAKEDLIKLVNENNHELLSEYKNTRTKVLIDFNCGHKPHWVTPNCYKAGNRCPLCKNKGESALYELLLDMGYETERQKKYDDLRNERLLSYDFYLPEYNLLIELDGDHHRELIPYCTKNMTQQEKDILELDAEIKFHNRQRKDRMKDKYAENNNIPLLRIPYIKAKIELDKWKELILNKIKEIELMSL